MKVKILIALAASSLFAASLVCAAPVLADDNIGASQASPAMPDSGINPDATQGETQPTPDVASPAASSDNDAMSPLSDPTSDDATTKSTDTDKDQSTADDDY